MVHTTSRNFPLTSKVMRGGGGGRKGLYKLLCLHKFVQFGHECTSFVGVCVCVQGALVSCDQPADALCMIVSMVDNLLGCKFAGCNPQQHSHPSVRHIFV